MKKTTYLLLLLCFSFALGAQEIIYVTENGNGVNDGTSWDNAFSKDSLQYAINSLESTTELNMVWIAKGNYVPTETYMGNPSIDSSRYFTFSLRNGVSIYGGFEGVDGETIESRATSDLDSNGKVEPWEFTNTTILSGEIQNDNDSTNNSYHVVTIAKKDSTLSTLDGFTIQYGYNTKADVITSSKSQFASGIMAYFANIQNCRITRCTSTSNYGTSSATSLIFGSAGYFDYCQVKGCMFDNSTAYINSQFCSIYGAGVCASNSKISQCKIDNCIGTTKSGSTQKTGVYGGGIYTYFSHIDRLMVSSCKAIQNGTGAYNYSGAGGAYMRGSRLSNSIIQNCLVSTANDYCYGGGVALANYKTDHEKLDNAGMYNCLITNNTCIGKSRANGGGVFNSLNNNYTSIPIINNTITNNHLYNSTGSMYNLYGSGMDCSNGYWHSDQAVSLIALHNNIIWGNVRGNGNKVNGLFFHSASQTHYNAVENQSLVGDANTNLSANNEDTNGPQFIKPTTFYGVSTNATQLNEIKSSDWSIRDSSLCINAGNPDTTGLDIPMFDLAELYRVADDTIDIGAYELINLNISISSSPGGMVTPDTDTIILPGENLDFEVAIAKSYEMISLTFSGIGDIIKIDDTHYRLSNVKLGGKLRLETFSLVHKVLYVSENGRGSKDGSDWENTLSGDQLQYAINSLVEENASNMVYVAAGTYSPTETYNGNTDVDSARFFTFSMRNGVTVYGGFEGVDDETHLTRTLDDIDENDIIEPWEYKFATILSGEIQNDNDSTNNSCNIVLFKATNKEKAILDGVSIQYGFNNIPGIHIHDLYINASGILCINGTVKNCHVSKCSVRSEADNTTETHYLRGAGVLLLDAIMSNSKMEDCNLHIDRRYSRAYGALLAQDSEVSNCEIFNIKGWTLTGYSGSTNNNFFGVGMHAHRSRILNNYIHECHGHTMSSGAYAYINGGGAYIRSSEFIGNHIESCSVESNHDIAVGGGLFIGNVASDAFDNACMINNVISNNTCIGQSRGNGGGVYHIVYANWLPIPIINNTITNNHLMKKSSGTSYLYGSGIDCSKGYWHYEDATPAILMNNVIWGNRMSDNIVTNQVFAHTGSNLQNNAVEAQQLSGSNNLLLHAGNDDANGPFFKNPSSFYGVSTSTQEAEELLEASWTIKDSSICLDAGMLDTTIFILPGRDILGALRIFNDTIDIGAFEYGIYNVTLSTNIEDAGILSGEGFFLAGDLVEISANSNEGYYFVNWTIDSAEISTDNITKLGVYNDNNVVANFSIFTYRLSVASNIQGAGIISGEGDYDYGDSVILTATPNEGYHFVNWTVDDVELSTDSITTYQIYNNVDIIANFAEVLSINEKDEKTFSLYPNPTSGIVYIHMSRTIDELEYISVVDLCGKTIDAIVNYDKQTYDIDLSNVPSGIYLVHIKGDNFNNVRRLIKK